MAAESPEYYIGQDGNRHHGEVYLRSLVLYSYTRNVGPYYCQLLAWSPGSEVFWSRQGSLPARCLPLRGFGDLVS